MSEVLPEYKAVDPAELVGELCRQRVAAYLAAPRDVREHAGIEEAILAGGYGYRQILELVQNGADAILEESEGLDAGAVPSGRLEVLLRDRKLYVANTGAPLSADGVEALLSSHSSPKRGLQIGRFGLGFKSLLRLGGQIDIFSSTASIRFDPERCRSEIRQRLGLAENTPAPAMRLAWNIDRAASTREDAVLGAFDWATTIVRAEVRDSATLSHLAEEIRGFPGQFLLFLPADVLMRLDGGGSPSRDLWRQRNGDEIELLDGDDATRWHVSEEHVQVQDEEARADATHLHVRDDVPLAWATPVDGTREEAGRFWAFFPTETPTRLSGILNAPWKLNSDRKAIIQGPWNEALMVEAAKLIARTLPKLSTTADPGRPLDAFPRSLDRKDEIASVLVEAVWQHLLGTEVVADGFGVLRSSDLLSRHPLDEQGLIADWMALASDDALRAVVHPSCLRGPRSSRLEAMAAQLPQLEANSGDSRGLLHRMSASVWFDHVATLDPQRAKGVLRLAESFSQQRPQVIWKRERSQLAIIPTSQNTLAVSTAVVIAPPGSEPPGFASVRLDLACDIEAIKVLKDVLGMRTLDNGEWRRLLESRLSNATNRIRWSTTADVVESDWCQVWETLRASPPDVRADAIARSRNLFRVRCRDGLWIPVHEALLSGAIVREGEEPSNDGVLIDAAFHANDTELLKELRVKDIFGDEWIELDVSGYKWPTRANRAIDAWLEVSRRGYMEDWPSKSSRPQQDLLKPVATTFAAPGWSLLTILTGTAGGRLTQMVLRSAGASAARLGAVEFGHSTRRQAYPEKTAIHPIIWALYHFGKLEVGDRLVPITDLLRHCEEPSLSLIAGWAQIKAALGAIAVAGGNLVSSRSSSRSNLLWQGLFSLSLTNTNTIDRSVLKSLWAAAAREGEIPRLVPTLKGAMPLEQMYVSESPDLVSRAESLDVAAIALDRATVLLWIESGARRLDELLSISSETTVGSLVPIVDAVPELKNVLKPEIRSDAYGQTCHNLALDLGGHQHPDCCLFWEGNLLFDLEQLNQLPRTERLHRLLREIACAGWLTAEPAVALSQIVDAQCENRRAFVAGGDTLAERVVRACGGRSEPLLEVIGEPARRAVIDRPVPLSLAGLALVMLGPALLAELRSTLEQEGLKPPRSWGSFEAVEFVSALGFPEAFGGAPRARREPELWVSGPVQLPPLHDYQEGVLGGLRDLVRSGTGRRRAVVSLPTGAGKTRVMVQASVELVLVPKEGTRSVLWVAQTDELCEQAVQAFRQVWINGGAEATDLRIVRLWGGTPTPAPAADDQPTVVVASIQTLTSRVGSDALAWLAQPGLLVVDECHHAVASSYTGLLEWLDAAPAAGDLHKMEPPVIGLSATPFRGYNEEESRWLANRFDKRWLPESQELLHEQLRAMGILSHIDDEALESDVELNDEELAHIERFSEIPDSFNRRLGMMEDRNRLIMDTIAASRQQSILLFANTVDHAEELTARLHGRGIAAACVSAKTPSAARRYFLNGFQSGELRVLCNQSVLTTGFDAPRTDMILIARQVLSPVRYMQMVGRGLRGPLNGGTERCRIVTVVDNLGRFRGKHPYHFCAQYFR